MASFAIDMRRCSFAQWLDATRSGSHTECDELAAKNSGNDADRSGQLYRVFCVQFSASYGLGITSPFTYRRPFTAVHTIF